MGTRNLTMVVLDDKFKVAQYGQWDGYPTGQGITICKFIKDLPDLLDFKIKVAALTSDTREAMKARWAEFGLDIEAKQGWVSMDISDKYGAKYPQFSRDTGAKVLDLILEGKVDSVELETEFAANSIFCEWAYVIDLDKEMVEVYEGFNLDEPLTPGDRFEHLMALVDNTRDETYYPIIKRAEFSFSEIKSWKDVNAKMESLEKKLNKDSEARYEAREKAKKTAESTN